MANERITEDIVASLLRDYEYYDDKSIVLSKQQTPNPRINDLLMTASKSGKGNKGYPEFIIFSKKHQNLVIVIECKPETKYHESTNRQQPASYAVDGVLWYAKYLSEGFDVIAIAVSGQTEETLKISTYLWEKDNQAPKTLVDLAGDEVERICKFVEYEQFATFDPEVQRKRYKDLISFSKNLHKYIRQSAKLSEAEKPLIVSGALIALSDAGFVKSYREYEPHELPQEMINAIKRQINKADIGQKNTEMIVQPYTFITAHPRLGEIDEQTGINPLLKIIEDIEKRTLPFINAYHNFDVIGQFYGEFLRYAGGDASMGIVLTPKHITELFCDLARLTPQSKVLDICAGTGGFLISAMMAMFKQAKTEKERTRIKQYSLMGAEDKPKMYALCASNMILRGDGKANIFQGDCFNSSIVASIRKLKPTVGMVNPPYAEDESSGGRHELTFVKHMLDLLEPNSTGIAIVPLSCAIQTHPSREAILESHRLEAVMSMPVDLFDTVGTITCIMVFTAHTPHNSNDYHKTWFGYWRDDGFIKIKNEGRVDYKNAWDDVKSEWLDMYFNKAQIAGKSVVQRVTADDEWCAEAYMETDYSTLNEDDFVAHIRDYALFKAKNI